MANYINQEILCEAYTHFDVDEYPTAAERARFKQDLKVFFEARAKFLFGNEVTVTVDFEEGSLKTYLKVIGSAAFLATTLVSDYGSIRQGIDTIAKDASLLAQSGILEIAFRTKTAFCDSVAVERRRGVYGKASDLMGRLDPIREDLSKVSVPAKLSDIKSFDKRIGDLVAWDLQVDRLFEKLDSEATKGCIAAGLVEELEKLPDTAPWEDRLSDRSFRTQVLKSDAEFFGRLGASAGGMKSVVSVVKKKMAARLKQYAPKRV